MKVVKRVKMFMRVVLRAISGLHFMSIAPGGGKGTRGKFSKKSNSTSNASDRLSCVWIF